MGSLWLRIKIWTKAILFGLLLLYALTFVITNHARQVKLWFWIGKDLDSSVFVLVLATFVAGIISAILLRTTLTTMRQIRDLQHKGRTDRLEREMADMRAKAGMLRAKPVAADTSEVPPDGMDVEP